MKRLSKQKQQQLVLVVMITVAVLAGIWYGLVRGQQAKLADLASKRSAVHLKLEGMKATIAQTERTGDELEEASALLANCEKNMASGDLYAWLITAVRDFKSGYKVEIPQFSPIDGPRNVTLLPNFPYKQASITVVGTGQFQDIGTFISDFENKMPFTRLCNLVIEPASSLGGDKEKLAFHLDIVTLVKSQAATRPL